MSKVLRLPAPPVHTPPGVIIGVIFDVDGVLTNSAALHARAWARLFAELLPDDVTAFTQDDYDRLVDGRSRLAGLVALLHDRQILDRFSAHDLEDATHRKQALFLDELAAWGAPPFDDVLPCLTSLADHGYRLGAASSSRSARGLLDAGRLDDRFDVIVDGVEIDRLGLASKPAPDLFVHTARLLQSQPSESAVVEDAVAGLEAAHRGGFGLVVGIDRSRLGDRGLDSVSDWTISSLGAFRPPLQAARP